MTNTEQSSDQLGLRAEYRKLPAVDALLRTPSVAGLAPVYGDERLTAAVRAVLEAARAAIAGGQPAPPMAALHAAVAARLAAAERPSLRPVINAAGVILHTNLGRAPLSEAALAAVQTAAGGYSNLEYDLSSGGRGSRHDHARRWLCELTGAEDALVVNNNAAAVYLVLAALCQAREVLISRGQLVEIGGGFRIPDVLRQSGARLVEVGTTNRTHLRDFDGALGAAGADVAAIMRVHSSNFRQLGFVAMPGLAELAGLAHARGVLLIDDLGSGTLLDTSTYGLASEPPVQESVAAGADLVTFSGDKLLGGPQAGIIVGKAALIERLRTHPMARALRVDKLTLAALEGTLHSYRRGAAEEIPVWQMIAASAEQLRQRAAAWQNALQAKGIAGDVWPSESAVGGGSLPGETLPTFVLAVPAFDAEAAAARLRQGEPAVLCRIQKDRLLFDPRTVLPAQDETLLAQIAAALPEGRP
jgi:L-seryl-tRNA(Ser) seleniumtransferase